jgi:hypothetical protein
MSNKIDFGRILDKAREALGLPEPAADSSTAEELITYAVVGAARLTRSTIDQSKAWWESTVEAAKKRAAELEAEAEAACSEAADAAEAESAGAPAADVETEASSAAESAPAADAADVPAVDASTTADTANSGSAQL